MHEEPIKIICLGTSETIRGIFPDLKQFGKCDKIIIDTSDASKNSFFLQDFTCPIKIEALVENFKVEMWIGFNYDGLSTSAY